jgi:hypothetical protein
MGRYDHRCLRRPEGFQKTQDVDRIVLVQVSGGFVCNNQKWGSGDCPGNAHALALPPGQVADGMMALMVKSDSVNAFLGPDLSVMGLDVQKSHAQQDVLQDGTAL